MKKHLSRDHIISIAEESGFKIVDEASLPGHEAKFALPPRDLDKGLLNLLHEKYPSGLYEHQVEAIRSALEKNDICISTSTASGKSLIFMTVAINALLKDNSARVLVLYPARALIQDQIDKWSSVLEPLNISYGYIDGGVSMGKRRGILSESRVVLMTPDVAHAWLLKELGDMEIKNFLKQVRILILDEAHSYDGVFGTNMAYFLRRLQAVSRIDLIITSTATLDDEEGFIEQLTGRRPVCFGPESDASATPSKTILLAKEVNEKSFDSSVQLLKNLAAASAGRFVAFADTRRMVEQLVTAANRSPKAIEEDGRDENKSDEEVAEGKPTEFVSVEILPYRAGYETVDRNNIQASLARGKLGGVVSTSALELGIDIGDIDVVVLLNQPPTMKGFWQRIGRGGRKREGICLFIDNRGTIADRVNGLGNYLQTSVEPNWLYLENRYVQYANALCTAVEYTQNENGEYDRKPFGSLPSLFNQLFENEINPSESIPSDLYPLKQRAQAGPHWEFPIRTGMDKSFQVKDRQQRPLGSLTFQQVLREAYPGAIYYYMGRPYRVNRFKYRQGEIFVYREKHRTTRPKSMTRVFPKFDGGTLQLFVSEEGFLAESELQVSERVTGFTEKKRSAQEEHEYGPGSVYYQKELNRFFETTGVSWWFPKSCVTTERIAEKLLDAFSYKFGVQSRDLGIGVFSSNSSPIGTEKCKGACIFDATHGSLRLTEMLATNFAEVVEESLHFAYAQKDQLAIDELSELKQYVGGIKQEGVENELIEMGTDDENWVKIPAPGEKAIYHSGNGPTDVVIIDYRYTPNGLLYELKNPNEKEHYAINPSLSKNAKLSKRIEKASSVKWLVPAHAVQPIPGETRIIEVNFFTGESRDC